MSLDHPVIIEAAINGVASQEKNPSVPRTPNEIASAAIKCIEAGAAIVHNHIDDFRIAGQEAAHQYAAGWREVREKYPLAILYPTIVFSDKLELRYEHFRHLSRMGIADMAAFDPGSTNLATGFTRGLPDGELVYAHSYSEIRYAFDLLAEIDLGPSMAIYEPTFMRAVVAWYRAGKLPRGSFIKYYFGGDHDLLTGEPGIGVGLPPTVAALEAYLEMGSGIDIPWAVAVVGGDLITSEIARYALKRGGHLRVGLEDFGGSRRPSNHELVKEAVDLCRSIGRPVATAEQARALLRLRSQKSFQPSSRSLHPTLRL
jgi:3-keto-5-aminohexanoate cleavage enzyme